MQDPFKGEKREQTEQLHQESLGEKSFEEQQDQHAYPADFPLANPVLNPGKKLPLQRFYDVNVTVSVELGRVEMPIGELVLLGESAVVELNRNISEAVDIMAQGVRIARGEVVVVDDRYAVRITHIEDEKLQSD